MFHMTATSATATHEPHLLIEVHAWRLWVGAGPIMVRTVPRLARRHRSQVEPRHDAIRTCVCQGRLINHCARGDTLAGVVAMAGVMSMLARWTIGHSGGRGGSSRAPFARVVPCRARVRL